MVKSPLSQPDSQHHPKGSAHVQPRSVSITDSTGLKWGMPLVFVAQTQNDSRKPGK
jgi:hypothetical protein